MIKPAHRRPDSNRSVWSAWMVRACGALVIARFGLRCHGSLFPSTGQTIHMYWSCQFWCQAGAGAQARPGCFRLKRSGRIGRSGPQICAGMPWNIFQISPNMELFHFYGIPLRLQFRAAQFATPQQDPGRGGRTASAPLECG